MSAPPAFDPWGFLARLADGEPNFRNFRSPAPENAISEAEPRTADDREACEERLAVAMIDGELTEEEARRVASRVVCCECGSPIAPPVTHCWGGDPVHRECGLRAWQQAVEGATVKERAA